MKDSTSQLRTFLRNLEGSGFSGFLLLDRGDCIWEICREDGQLVLKKEDSVEDISMDEAVDLVISNAEEFDYA